MKALLLSIRPEHAYNIITGKKTLELRKRVPKDFKGWVYVYVTKGKPLLTHIINEWCLTEYGTKMSPNGKVFTVNGTIPFRFWFDEYEKIPYAQDYEETIEGIEMVEDLVYYITCGDLEKSCISYEELEQYGKGKDLYAWHIKNLEIFDKPMELGEFYKHDYWFERKHRFTPITKAPQSYMYAWVKEEMK